MATPSAAAAQRALTTAWTSDWWMTRSSGLGVARQAAVGPRGGVVQGDDDARARSAGTRAADERAGVRGGSAAAHGAVPRRRLLGQPLDLALQLGQLLVLPGDDLVALTR